MKRLILVLLLIGVPGILLIARGTGEAAGEDPADEGRESVQADSQTDQTGRSESGNTEDAQADPGQASVDETELLIEDNQSDAAVVPEERSLNAFGVWDFARMIIILAAVVGVIYLIFFLLKRSSHPKLQNNELMRVLSTQTIANNRSLHLVEVGRQIFLVGAGDNSVNLVSEITDKESIDEIRLRMSEQTAGEKHRFRDVLSGIFGQPGMKQDKIYPMKVDESTQYIKQQRERLKNL